MWEKKVHLQEIHQYRKERLLLQIYSKQSSKAAGTQKETEVSIW